MHAPPLVRPATQARGLRTLPLRALLCLLVPMLCCAPARYRGPTLLATTGAFLAAGGAVTYSVGDREGSLGLQRAGAATLATGLALLITAGIWAAVRSQCESDSDCTQSESCQHLYTSAGIYGHCIAR